MKKHMLKEASGSTFLEISKNNLNKMKLNLPSFNEQRRIATFLSTFDSKIDLEKEILKEMKALKKGLLQQMFV